VAIADCPKPYRALAIACHTQSVGNVVPRVYLLAHCAKSFEKGRTMTRSKPRDVHSATRSSVGITRSDMTSEFDQQSKRVVGGLPGHPRPPFSPTLPRRIQSAAMFGSGCLNNSDNVHGNDPLSPISWQTSTRARRSTLFLYRTRDIATSAPASVWRFYFVGSMLHGGHIKATADHPPTLDPFGTACGYMLLGPLRERL
jgi:hypothetical protein